MKDGVPDLPGLARLTLSDPRKALRRLLAVNPPFAARVAGLALAAVVSALLLHLSIAIAPPLPGNPVVDLMASASPFMSAITQVLVLGGAALLMHILGRMAGGRGRPEDALLAVVWLQAIMISLQAAQVVALLILPPLASILGILGIFLFLWLLTQFVAELHGFRQGWKVLVVILAVFLAISVLASIMLVASLGPEAFGNV